MDISLAHKRGKKPFSLLKPNGCQRERKRWGEYGFWFMDSADKQWDGWRDKQTKGRVRDEGGREGRPVARYVWVNSFSECDYSVCHL